jgi:hypothetical protein
MPGRIGCVTHIQGSAVWSRSKEKYMTMIVVTCEPGDRDEIHCGAPDSLGLNQKAMPITASEFDCRWKGNNSFFNLSEP